MARRRPYQYSACGCARITCPQCEPVKVETPSGPGLKSHRAFLSPRMPEAKWLREASMYTWSLWRHWKPPRSITVETTADVRKRERAWLRTASPYSWRCEKLTPAQRIALGCLPAEAAPKQARAAA